MDFSAKDKRILKKLTKKLPRFPMPGWEQERICAALNEDWDTVLRVTFKCKKAAELREPDLPIIRYGKGGYQVVGATDRKGHWRLA